MAWPSLEMAITSAPPNPKQHEKKVCVEKGLFFTYRKKVLVASVTSSRAAPLELVVGI